MAGTGSSRAGSVAREGQVTGRVLAVDELDFELADDAGDRYRFAVAMDASLEAGDLAQLARDGTRVVVDYDDETAGASVAHRVFLAPPPADLTPR